MGGGGLGGLARGEGVDGFLERGGPHLALYPVLHPAMQPVPNGNEKGLFLLLGRRGGERGCSGGSRRAICGAIIGDTDDDFLLEMCEDKGEVKVEKERQCITKGML